MSGYPVLDSHLLDSIRPEGAKLTIPAGRTVESCVSQPSFLVLESGQISLLLGGEADLPSEITRLGPGTSLGQAGVFGDDGRCFSAVAATDSSVRVFSAAWLRSAVARLPKLREHILAMLAWEGGAGWILARDLRLKGQAAQRVARTTLHQGALVARSRAMKEVKREIRAMAETMEPVTILGERGTGKTFVANKIYEAGCGPNRPFVEIDCRRLGVESAVEVLFGSARPGCHTLPPAQYGAVHLAHGGVLLLRHVECLPAPCQHMLLACMRGAQAGGEDHFPRARLLCTTRQDLLALTEGDRFHPGLAEALLHRVLPIPNLESRRLDIPELITQFLRERHDRSELSKDAAAVLYSRDYPTYHAGELKGVVNLAAVMANGEPIRAEHLIGERRSQTLTIDPIRSSAGVRWFTVGPGLKVLQTVSACFFATVVLATAFFPEQWVGRMGNDLVWLVWEPLLIFSFLFLGRVWCAICPLALPGLGLQRVAGLRRKVPHFFKEYGPLLAGAGIAAIYLINHHFQLSSYPARTSVLLLTLVGLAAMCGLIFERHAWCENLCFMGTLAGTFSNASSLRVWANPWFCTNRCRNAPCLNGTEGQTGCPTCHRPNQDTSLSQCKLCLKCIRLCPEQAVSLHLSLPLTRLGNATTLDARLTPVLLSLLPLSVVVLAQDLLPAPGTGWSLLAVAGGMVAIGVLSTRALHRIFAQEAAVDSSLPARVAGALMVVVWGSLAADQIEHLSWLQTVRIGTLQAAAAGLDATPVTAGVSVELLLQLTALLTSAVLGLTILRSTRNRLNELGGSSSRWKWTALRFLVVAHLALSVHLVVLAA